MHDQSNSSGKSETPDHGGRAKGPHHPGKGRVGRPSPCEARAFQRARGEFLPCVQKAVVISGVWTAPVVPQSPGAIRPATIKGGRAAAVPLKGRQAAANAGL